MMRLPPISSTKQAGPLAPTPEISRSVRSFCAHYGLPLAGETAFGVPH